MSRIGKRVLNIPSGVDVKFENNQIVLHSPTGQLAINANSNDFDVQIQDQKLTIVKKSDRAGLDALYGTINALVNNALIGLTKGISKHLKIVGVGYKAAVTGSNLTLNLGYSKPVIMPIPKDLKVECKVPTEILITGFNKEHVGQFAAEVRSKRPPEPYKGKGVMYFDEIIQRKVGKTAEGAKK